MATIRCTDNPGGQSAVIDVDGAVVGGIALVGKGVYAVDTQGRVPAIDGCRGASLADAWAAAAQKVAAGGVVLVTPVAL